MNLQRKKTRRRRLGMRDEPGKDVFGMNAKRKSTLHLPSLEKNNSEKVSTGGQLTGTRS